VAWDTDELIHRLRQRGVVPANGVVRAELLSGGVSGDVAALHADGVDLVAKRALARLRVAEEWLARPERSLTEAAALREADRLRPGAVPPVVDVDPDTCTIVIGHAPNSWRNWKSDLLDRRADPGVAAELGRCLAGWHGGTTARRGAAFDDTSVFVQLRIDPFHRTVAARHPDVANRVEAVVDRMLATRTCLVHGDFSPKNVLVGDGRLWVLDWEVAHRGDPVFDLAFLLTHLLLKAIHQPARRAAYRHCADAFLDTYGHIEDPAYLAAQIGCLLLSRVDGKSPAEYLTASGRSRARRLAREILMREPRGVAELWDAL
jgi:tRNA A-37 threonylcarbamoyl transferase component Bud32